jgi:tRNA A22 N-methylase
MKSLLYKSVFNSKRSILQFCKPSNNIRTYLSANINNYKYYEHIDSENLKYIDPINVPSTPNEKFNHKDFLIIPDFITKEEEEMLVAKSNFKLRRIRHYEDSHFDGVIQNYKEVTVSDWTPFQNEVNPIIERAKSLIKGPINWLPTHILGNIII